MADYCFDFSAAPGGDGSVALPFSTFVGMPLGVHRYMLKRGSVFNETFTFGAGTNGATLTAYGEGPKPVIDCGNVRATGVDLNAKVGCEVHEIRVINQNAGPTNAGIRVSGSGNKVHHNELINCQTSIHINSSAGNLVYENYIDAGNPLTPTIAYGIRINAVGSINNQVFKNEVTSTAIGMTFMSGIQVYGGGAGNWVYRNNVHDILADGISFRFGTTGCYMVSNFVGRSKILDALVCEGSSGNFIWNNIGINSGDVIGHFGPALKMGNDFGASSPASLNDIANNLLISLGANNVINLVPIAVNNTFRNNLLWRPSGGNIVNLSTGGSTAALSFGQWQAAGYSSGEIFGDPLISASYKPFPSSLLLSSGANLGSIRGLSGSRGKRFIGCHAPQMMLRVN